MHPTTEPYYNIGGTRTCDKGKAVRDVYTHTARWNIALAGCCSISSSLALNVSLLQDTESRAERVNVRWFGKSKSQ